MEAGTDHLFYSAIYNKSSMHTFAQSMKSRFKTIVGSVPRRSHKISRYIAHSSQYTHHNVRNLTASSFHVDPSFGIHYIVQYIYIFKANLSRI